METNNTGRIIDIRKQELVKAIIQNVADMIQAKINDYDNKFRKTYDIPIYENNYLRNYDNAKNNFEENLTKLTAEI